MNYHQQFKYCILVILIYISKTFTKVSKKSKTNFFSPTLRLNKITNLSSLNQLKDDEGFTLVELIVVVMMIGILSSIAIPQFMTAADKAKQKEATGIVSGLVKGATAYQTEYGVLPENATQLSEYAKFGFEYINLPFKLSSEISKFVLKFIPLPKKFFSLIPPPIVVPLVPAPAAKAISPVGCSSTVKSIALI